MIIHVLGQILLIEAALMLLPCITALCFGEAQIKYFLVTMGLLALTGGLFILLPVTDRRIYYKDGFAIVSIGWVVMSLFGALPFYLSGEIPSYLDALFETVSGFTTTGASILNDVEVLSRCMLFWRSFTHWIGGMGVLVFLTALIPAAAGGALNLMRAESPGVEVEKLVPKSRHTAVILYGIYVFLTLLQLVLMLAGKMPFFDALTVTFGTAGTGGFGVLNTSVASYSPYIQTVITVFLVLFGINFNLYFLLLCKKFRDVLRSEELKVYLIIFFAAVGFIAVDLYACRVYGTLTEAIHQSAFQVSSLMSTAGFSTADFNTWPEVSRIFLLLVMCVGGCAGSTAGGLKVSRVIIIFKSAMSELKRVVSPRRVNVVKYDGKRVKDDVVRISNAYIVIYVAIIALSVVILSFDKMDFITNFSGTVATFNNVGPGFGAVGPAGNYSLYSPVSKTVFIFDMLLGRLEIFPILVVISSVLHKKSKKSSL